MRLIIGGLMEDSMSEREVTVEAAKLLAAADKALTETNYAEAHEYIKAARVLVEGVEHQRLNRPRRVLKSVGK